jgi:hypothetical protein
MQFHFLSDPFPIQNIHPLTLNKFGTNHPKVNYGVLDFDFKFNIN